MNQLYKSKFQCSTIKIFFPTNMCKRKQEIYLLKFSYIVQKKERNHIENFNKNRKFLKKCPVCAFLKVSLVQESSTYKLSHHNKLSVWPVFLLYSEFCNLNSVANKIVDYNNYPEKNLCENECKINILLHMKLIGSIL